MRNKLRNWFFVLAVGLAASASVGTVAEAASFAPGIGMKVPLVRQDVLPAGYRGYGFGHGYGTGYYGDGFYWPPEVFPPQPWRHGPPPVTYFEPSDYQNDYQDWSPPRPRTCGEFYYWNGRCCVDARRHRPYIGPKW
jgi:hypothetical protein